MQLLSFYLLFRNYLVILKMLTETLLRIPFSVIGRCSLVLTSQRLQGKCARINLSPAASGIILQNHRRLSVSIFSVKIAAFGSLKRITWRIFIISKLFQRKKIVKLSAPVQEVPSYYYKSSKKVFISWHNPFNIDWNFIMSGMRMWIGRRRAVNSVASS